MSSVVFVFLPISVMETAILLIEGNRVSAAMFREMLASAEYTLTWVPDGLQGLKLARENNFDMVFVDIQLAGTDGLELLRNLRRHCPALTIVVISAHIDSAAIITATRFGAYDYLEKPIDHENLIRLIDRVQGKIDDRSDLAVGLDEHKSTLVGQSRTMRTVYKEIGRIAALPVTVLVNGETGTGKELVARAIHEFSDRADQPFVAINCAAIPESLLASELFGHERGAFTGAHTARKGKFEQADGGTLFLDEIGDMDHHLQARILRILEDRSLQRLGGNGRSTRIDVRIISATHRNLPTMIQDHTFREDLYHRLAVSVITLPPLRERRTDIPLLIDFFLKRYMKQFGMHCPGMDSRAVEYLSRKTWSGNVRELENYVRSALVRARGLAITYDLLREIDGILAKNSPKQKITVPSALPAAEQTAEPVETPAMTALPIPAKPRQSEPARDPADENEDLLDRWVRKMLDQAEHDHVRRRAMDCLDRVLIRYAMHESRGNRTRAAKMLGINRLTLRKRLSDLGIEVKSVLKVRGMEQMVLDI